MRSNLLKSLIGISLAVSPAIGFTQTGADADRERSGNEDRVIGAIFVGVIFAIVLFAYASQDGDDEDVRVSP